VPRATAKQLGNNFPASGLRLNIKRTFDLIENVLFPATRAFYISASIMSLEWTVIVTSIDLYFDQLFLRSIKHRALFSLAFRYRAHRNARIRPSAQVKYTCISLNVNTSLPSFVAWNCIALFHDSERSSINRDDLSIPIDAAASWRHYIRQWRIAKVSGDHFARISRDKNFSSVADRE